MQISCAHGLLHVNAVVTRRKLGFLRSLLMIELVNSPTVGSKLIIFDIKGCIW